MIGLALVLFRSALILWIALTGLLLTVFYMGRPINLKYRVLGELVVCLFWGPLMFQGAYVAQAGILSAKALAASVPFGVLVALVPFANNICEEHCGAGTIRPRRYVAPRAAARAMAEAQKEDEGVTVIHQTVYVSPDGTEHNGERIRVPATPHRR